MTNKEFIRRLRLAKVEALGSWPDEWCISNACMCADLYWGTYAVFDKDGDYQNYSSGWVRDHAKSPDDIARVFDESIKALGGKP